MIGSFHSLWIPNTNERLENSGKCSLLYPHATMYASRTWDSINVNGCRRDVMLEASNEDALHHPFWYARVLGVYHANVRYRTPVCQHPCAWSFYLYDGSVLIPNGVVLVPVVWIMIGYEPARDDGRLGPLGAFDPAHVIRPCHLIPTFHLQLTTVLLARSVARDTIASDYVNW